MSTMQNYPELLADIADRIGDLLQAEGIEPEKAADIGLQAAEHVRKNYSGQLLYLPSGRQYELAARDKEIYQRYQAGETHSAISVAYGISVVRVYQVIKRLREDEIQRRQPDMFSSKRGGEAC